MNISSKLKITPVFIGEWCDFDYPEETTLFINKANQEKIKSAMADVKSKGYDSIRINMNLSRQGIWEEQWVVVYSDIWFWHSTVNGVEFVER